MTTLHVNGYTVRIDSMFQRIHVTDNKGQYENGHTVGNYDISQETCDMGTAIENLVQQLEQGNVPATIV